MAKRVYKDIKARKRDVQKAILKAFIPFTEENMLLAYKPNQFFNRLEYLDRLVELTKANRQTVQSTISRAKRAGLLKVDEKGILQTTWRGKIKTKVRPNKKLRKYLVIIFDVPETRRRDRNQLRAYLRANYCEMVQKSVWKTKYDIYDELLEVIGDLEIINYVSVFLADELE
ncbi:CRISPR-associated endonuclease Cas2 [Candidatus Parcubacteria bacterium]|nr:CRISPR-associated endonuclease Cas2 [Candidatus Parcubacteria bacterium]